MLGKYLEERLGYDCYEGCLWRPPLEWQYSRKKQLEELVMLLRSVLVADRESFIAAFGEEVAEILV